MESRSKTPATVKEARYAKFSSSKDNKEIQLSLDADEGKKFPLVGEVENLSFDADCVPRPQKNEKPGFPVLTEMVPWFPHPLKDEPNSFHF